MPNLAIAVFKDARSVFDPSYELVTSDLCSTHKKIDVQILTGPHPY